MDYQPQYIKNTCNQTPETDITKDPIEYIDLVSSSENNDSDDHVEIPNNSNQSIQTPQNQNKQYHETTTNTSNFNQKPYKCQYYDYKSIDEQNLQQHSCPKNNTTKNQITKQQNIQSEQKSHIYPYYNEKSQTNLQLFNIPNAKQCTDNVDICKIM